MTDSTYAERIQDALGKVLETTRKDLGLNAVQAAELLGGDTKARTVMAYERGERRPSMHRLLELADAYQVSPLWLLQQAIRKADEGTGCPSCGHRR